MPQASAWKRYSPIVIREARHDLEKEKALRAATLEGFFGVSNDPDTPLS